MGITNLALWLTLSGVSAYWDIGTTTQGIYRWDDRTIRQSRFRWQRSESDWFRLLYPQWDWVELRFRRRLYVCAGLSHEFENLGTATILNRRSLITAANLLDPYMNRQRDLRIWALGRSGQHITPWRYRVWRVTRMFPKSLNPEHCHGPFCYHSPRHDVAIIHSLDQMFVFTELYHRFAYAFRSHLPTKKHNLMRNDLWFAGSGFEYIQHIYENYKIFFARTNIDMIVDCSKYLPKWWGKFICIKNHHNFPGVQNGGGLYDKDLIVGLGCFEIRYNEDRIFAFTDLRYYVDYIYLVADIYPGEYYEYAYPQWGAYLAWMTEDAINYPFIPHWQIQDDFYPLGKKK